MPLISNTFRFYTQRLGASTVDHICFYVCIYLFSKNPSYVGVIVAVFLLLKALWVQLDISGEFRNGAIPGVLSLSTKFLPTVTNLLRRLAEEGQRLANGEPQRNAAPASKSFSSIPNDVSSCASLNVNSSESRIL